MRYLFLTNSKEFANYSLTNHQLNATWLPICWPTAWHYSFLRYTLLIPFDGYTRCYLLTTLYTVMHDLLATHELIKYWRNTNCSLAIRHA